MPKKINKDKIENKDLEALRRESISSNESEVIYPFESEETLDNNKVFIECHGATVYDPNTRQVLAGVEFLDEQNPNKGFKIIDREIHAPDHRRRRLIKKEHENSIRRCQACQDLTVRLMRREGVDFFIPSPKHPRKTKLKSIEQTW